ncbi:hypothetical protein [Staphylococcus lugdunensis]|uniref:hypothetical protein n=1 Tax=Staphylococcus lugdunensis TaxID=28035 RepID=UPI001F579D90|nr:hypothetical protein [Staphylococcus lugdunensis]MCI2762828.1 hypothetical protein [Staphylococcus lugdunensis]MCI2813310.1 hypothetical protein [Staphylococcus lugdunensis]MCO6567937.1 hypothetical protein [Staphylococcus lugdunensis]MCO6569689.1 hypothetical protein [Staphylococcus lugdunensis]MCO6572679.1 hypothetical protein [Staphylococcus lugdunensis]
MEYKTSEDRGPQQIGFQKESQQTKQVGGGAPTKRNAKSISPSTVSRPCIASFFQEHKVT